MKILRTLGLAGAIVGTMAWLDARSQRRTEEKRQRDRVEKTRWEGEGGSTPTGAQINELPPNESPRA
jgi:hypothetical protein